MTTTSDAIQLRLTANQVSLIWSGLNEVIKSYSVWQSNKKPAASYPFKIFPPPRTFNRGAYSSELMTLVRALWKNMRSKTTRGGRFCLNTIEIRAAILGIRISMDVYRFHRHAGRKFNEIDKRRYELDDASRKRKAMEAGRSIRTLERHLKRANYRLQKLKSRTEFDRAVKTWRDHLRFMRQHFAYFKIRRVPFILRSKTAYQQILDEITGIALKGIQRAGYQPPDTVQLRKILRLFLAYTRRDRLTYSIRQLLYSQMASIAQTVLCSFIEERLTLVESGK